MLDKPYHAVGGNVRKVHPSVFYPPPTFCDDAVCERNLVMLRFDPIPGVTPIRIPPAKPNTDGNTFNFTIIQLTEFQIFR